MAAILDQTGDGPIGTRATGRQRGANVAMVIPAAHGHLNETHAGLAEPTGQ